MSDATSKASITKNKSGEPGKTFIGILVLIGLAAIFVYKGDDSSKTTNSAQVADTRIDPEKSTRQQAADAAEKARKDAECRQDLTCWAEKGQVTASVYCRDKVEKLASYSMKWTDAWYESKFSHYRWSRKAGSGQGVVTYLGDKAQFQNGFGAYQNVIYTCDMNPGDRDHTILDVSASPGRLN